MLLKTSYKMKPPVSAKIVRGHLLADPAGYWPFNEYSGNKVFDLSGNGNIGTHTGATWVIGNFGSAINYDGDDYTNCGNGASLNWGASDFSVVFWAKASGHDGHIVSKSHSAPYWYIKMLVDGDLYFKIYDGVTVAGIDANITWGDNLWHMMACIVDHSSATGLKMYVDAIVSSRTADPTSVGSLNNAVSLGFGTRSTAANGNYWTGQLSSVMIYNRAISASEIALLYREPFCMFERRARPVAVPAAAAVTYSKSGTGFRPITGADRLRGLRHNALY